MLPNPSWERKSDMLLVAKSLQELRFSSLMMVYEEGNRENGHDFYPHLSSQQQLLQAEQDFYAYLREDFFRQPGAAYYIWSEKGRYVSALRLEPCQDGLLLEALETHPEYRGRGYAKMLIRSVLETAEYERIYVHISRRNAPSIAVHTACGFRKILGHAVYADGSVLHSNDTYLYEKPTL